MKNALITVPVNEVYREKMQVLCQDYQLTFLDSSQVKPEDLVDKQVLFGNLPVSMVSQMKDLAFLQLNSAGFDPYVVPGVTPEGAIVCNAGAAYGPCVGEHLIAMTFAMAKKLHRYHIDQASSFWTDEGQVLPLHGLTVLVLGLGAIGGNCARIMHLLGNKVIGIRKTKTNKPEYVDEVHTLEELNQVLPQADIVIAALPASKETSKVFGAEQFALMKSTALLFNAGRGSLIDTDALLAAVQSGQIAGAGLDVTDPEPLPADHPLWKEKNVMITPHVSGGFHMPGTLDYILELGIRNMLHFAKGEPMEYQVNA